MPRQPPREQELGQLPLVLQRHVQSREAVLMTDASRLYGIGFALGHYVDGHFKLVSCGSKSLTPAQRRYSTVELECLAVHFGITKYSFYLKGSSSFTVATDHNPLLGVFKKDIFEVSNPRLQRIREKLV